jgi:hypoxanthine phosphoribosyltransferase
MAGKVVPPLKLSKVPLISKDAIRARVQEIAGEISADYQGLEPVVIGVLTGAVFFFGDLVRALTIPCRMDFIRAESYGSGSESSGNVRLTKDLDLDVRGEAVILVEDIVDTGLTIHSIVDLLSMKDPASVAVCALIDKSERRCKDVRIDYTGFRVEEGFLVGYGLDFKERYRQLPDIYTLE